MEQTIAGNIKAKKVLVLLTGGTAGMRRDPQFGSLVPGKGYLAESLRQMLSDSRSSYKYPEVTVSEYPVQLDSSDMSPEDWARIALDIQSEYVNFDGFVVVMGTVSLVITSDYIKCYRTDTYDETTKHE
jgi:L-asparaginase